MDSNMVLTGGREYTVNYSVLDNGDFDSNSTHGAIHAPVVPGTSGSGSGETGCVLNPEADGPMELDVLLIFALLIIARRWHSMK